MKRKIKTTQKNLKVTQEKRTDETQQNESLMASGNSGIK